jgi:hypothetical protein
MRTTWLAAVAAVVVSGVAASARADDREAAVAVVERAIKAHGGDEALVRSHILSRTGKGNMSLSGTNVAFTEDTVWCLPDRIRMTLDITKGARVTLIVNGDKGWQAVGGAVIDLGKAKLEEAREELSVLWIGTLTPLLKDPYTLASIPDRTIGGSPAAGVKVSAKGHADVNLYFDKGTNLLVRIDGRAHVEGLLVNKSYVLSDYQDVDGVKLPGREVQLIEGKKYIERTSANYKLLSRTDDATFAKP